jgi:hypothetical protein
MTELPKERGKVVDELIPNPRRLFIAHACFFSKKSSAAESPPGNCDERRTPSL